MKKVIHKTSFNIRPMIVIGNVERVTKYIWETSTSVPNDLPRDLVTDNHDLCYLDPGGYYYLKGGHKRFEIDGHQFDIQLCKVEEVLVYMGIAQERVPGYIRFPMWRDFIIMPKEIFEKLESYLKELEKTDECLHAELEEKEALDRAINPDKGVFRAAGIIMDYLRNKFKKN